ncbi:MAG: histidine phosphatase family protein [Vicinamibacterales bacterium]
MAVEIRYETHSLTTDNEAGIATGWLSGRLSARGRQLARELGERYRDSQVAAVFVSDLARAVETATVAFADSPIPIYRDARLRECNYGALNGMPVARLAAERARRIETPFPNGQSYRQVIDVTADFLDDLVSEWDGRQVVVIAHSANKWALDYLLNGAAIEDLVDAPFDWQEGWRYVLPSGYRVS